MMLPIVDQKRTVKATRGTDAWPEYGYAEPGEVFIDAERVYPGHLLFACPGCGRMGSIRATHPKNVDGPSWDIVAGSMVEPETLSLSPSINCVGCCQWHGHLKNGTFESC